MRNTRNASRHAQQPLLIAAFVLDPTILLSENGHDARVSMLTRRAMAHQAAISTSKSYSVQRDWVFEPKVFAELKNAQGIVLAALAEAVGLRSPL